MSMSTRSDRVYYVLSGKGEFKSQRSNLKVGKSDVVIVPKNTPYDYMRIGSDKLKMFMIHAPAFDEKSVVDFSDQQAAFSCQPDAEILKFTLRGAKMLERAGRKGWIYNTKDDFENANVVYLEMKYRHGKVKDLKSDRIYYIVEGKGEFKIQNSQPKAGPPMAEKFKIKETDVVIVPKDTPYDFENKGKSYLKLVLINCPAFERESSVKLE